MSIVDAQNLKGVCEVNLQENVTALNVFYWKASFATPQADDDVGAAIETRVEAIYAAIDDELDENITLGDLYCYAWDGTEWDLIDTRQPSLTCTGLGGQVAHGVAALVRMYTIDSRVIGRKYFAGMGEDAINDGVWDEGCLTALAAAGTAWGTQGTVAAGNFIIPGVWSTVLVDVITANGVFVVPTYPGYQRRRRPGVGM